MDQSTNEENALLVGDDLFDRAQPVHENDLRVLYDTILINTSDDTARLAAIDNHIAQFHTGLAACCGISASRARMHQGQNRLMASKSAANLKKQAGAKDLGISASSEDQSSIGYLPTASLEENEDVINPPWPLVQGATARPVAKGKVWKSHVVIPHGKGIPDPSYFEAYAALLQNSPQFLT